MGKLAKTTMAKAPLKLAHVIGSDFVDDTLSGVGPSHILEANTTSLGINLNGLTFDTRISADGSRVAFTTLGNNISDGDNNNSSDVYVKDLKTGAVTLVSQAIDGGTALGASFDPHFSTDGSKIIFTSYASNLTSNNTGVAEIYVKDLSTGGVTLLSANASGEAADNHCFNAVFSADGSKVAFVSFASNLVAGDSSGTADIFIKDLVTGAVQRVAMPTVSTRINVEAVKMSFSPDGSKLVFSSEADGIVAGDSNGASDIFVADLQSGTVTLVSSGNLSPNADGASFNPHFTADGTHVVFDSWAGNLVAGDSNSVPDIFSRDLITGAITRLSTDSLGQQVSGYSLGSNLSSDPFRIVFQSSATDYVPWMTGNGFVKDIATGAVANLDGSISPHALNQSISIPDISADGLHVVFGHYAQTIVNGASVESFGVYLSTLQLVVSDGDSINGRDGFDTVTYAGSRSKVTLDLRDVTGASNTGDAKNDQFTSIEKFVLTDYDDLFFGSNVAGSSNVASGGAGNDDFTSGGVGTFNVFDGGAGADTLRGRGGSDTFYGGTDDDRLVGGGGEDWLYGEAGADKLFGGVGKDSLFGGDGKDTLVGNAGDDVLAGGADKDRFVFNKADSGRDTVLDFELGTDVLEFVHLRRGDIELSVVGFDTVLHVTNSDVSIVIQGVTDTAALSHAMIFT